MKLIGGHPLWEPWRVGIGLALILALLLLLLLVDVGHAVSRENCEFVPSTTVCLSVPQGFEPSKNFDGYSNLSIGASIMVTELPGGFSRTSNSLSDSALKRQGLEVLSRAGTVVDGQPGVLIQVRQQVKGRPFLKWILLFGSQERSVLISGIYPEGVQYSAPLGDVMETALRSAHWEPQRDVDLTDGLPYKISAPDGLKLARRMQNSLIFSRNGNLPNPTPQDPTFVVGRSFVKRELDNRLNFAIERARAISSVTDMVMGKIHEIEVDGLKGYELTAQAVDKDSSVAMALYQTVLFDEGHYYIMVGLVGADNKSLYLDKFRQMAQTFRVR